MRRDCIIKPPPPLRLLEPMNILSVLSMNVFPNCICICMLRGSTHYNAITPRVLSHLIVDFLGSRRMETALTSIEVLLRPTLVQSDEPSDLRGSMSPTTRHRCMHILVYTAPGSTRRSPIQLWTGPARRCLTSVIEPTPIS